MKGLTGIGILGLILLLHPTSIFGANFAGVAVSPGAVTRAAIPLNAQEQSYASEGGNGGASSGVAVLAVPRSFDPTKTWPVLVVFSTSDGRRQNREDLAEFYLTPALKENWVLLAGDGPRLPRLDNAAWRIAFTLAAIDALHHSFPDSRQWPIACAGFSGGARRAAFLAPVLANYGCHITGLFLAGMIDDQLSEGYKKFQPSANFLRTPVFLSSGRDDKIATLSEQETVKVSAERTGFKNIRQETFPGPHALKYQHIVDALHWFRQAQGSG